MKIALIPLDNRPVSYSLAAIIAQTDKSIELSLPPKKYLGNLKKPANIKKLYKWLEDLPEQDYIILALDTLTYGGLIPSRRSPETLEKIRQRIAKLKTILQNKKAKIYAFSSIMRISNNNINEEEKEYWSEWGKKIYDYSYDTHKSGYESNLVNSIPSDILSDYIETRKRNFAINNTFLEWEKEGIFQTLIFSKDDCAQYGLNVKEAELLQNKGAQIKTGTDEIPLTLLAKTLKKSVKICPIFLEDESKHLFSNYEDISIEKSVKNQIEAAGCEVTDEKKADIILYINNFKKRQGEIVMQIGTQGFSGRFEAPNKPYMIADVRFTNGADNNFVRELFTNDLKSDNFYGYSAWNTSSNTLGSLICGAKIKFLAKDYNRKAFNRLHITRFLDDWAYQANIRQTLRKPNVNSLKSEMTHFENIVNRLFGTKEKIKYNFPWKRLFEVEIAFE